MHPAGHTALMIAGPVAGLDEVVAAETAVRATADPTFIVEVAVVVCVDGLQRRWGQIDEADVSGLGVAGVVVVVVRPDGQLGMVADQDHAGALTRYQRLVASRLRGSD